MTPLHSQFNVTLAALESANDEVHELRGEIVRLHAIINEQAATIVQLDEARRALEHKP